ncbi:MAG: thioredoxin [Spirochaetota bacterium]
MSEHLTLETFKTKVFNFEANKDWKYEGDLPALIDFYADWCGPCKMIAPVLEELSTKYAGKLHVYKVNTEEQPQLAGMFEVTSIPTLYFVPMEGAPRFIQGALPKKELERAISEVCGVQA